MESKLRMRAGGGGVLVDGEVVHGVGAEELDPVVDGDGVALHGGDGSADAPVVVHLSAVVEATGGDEEVAVLVEA